MSESARSSPSVELDSPIRRLRLLSRLAIALLLDLIGIARGGRRMIDTLLIGVIVQANLGGTGGATERQATGEAAGALPDELRRPIAINAIAASLGLPFETVRRRVRKLADQGLCRLVSGGVIVPAAVLATTECEAMGLRAHERLRAFFYEVSDLALLDELPGAAVRLEAGARPTALAIRLAGEYVLREIDGLMESLGGPVDGLIAFAVFRANTAHFPHHLRGGEGYAAEDMVEDSRRRPVRLVEVAARLGMPQETVRRHLVRLVDRGVCRRVSDGFVIPGEVFAREDVRRAVFNNAANLRRLMGGLARLGVLDLWERRRRES